MMANVWEMAGGLGAVAVVLAVAGGLFWWVWRSRVVFVVRVSGGRAERVRGEVDEHFVRDVERICDLWGIREGEVLGVVRKGNVRIVCRGEQVKGQRWAFQNALDHPV